MSGSESILAEEDLQTNQSKGIMKTSTIAGVAAYKAFLIVDTVAKSVGAAIVLFKAWRAGTLAQVFPVTAPLPDGSPL